MLRTRWERGGIEVEGGCLYVVFVFGGKLLCEKMMRELFRPDGAGRIRNDSDNLVLESSSDHLTLNEAFPPSPLQSHHATSFLAALVSRVIIRN